MAKPIVSVIITMLMGFAFSKVHASSTIELNEYAPLIVDIVSINDTLKLNIELSSCDSLVHHSSESKKEARKKKIVSSVLALPFPFGFIGAHRVMLGCKPWVPVVYVATFGGCFGLLPLIDFFVIAFSKDISQYENNPHIFMWLK